MLPPLLPTQHAALKLCSSLKHEPMPQLLQWGADAAQHSRLPDGTTALHLAAEKRHKCAASILIKHGANPFIEDGWCDDCPLHTRTGPGGRLTVSLACGLPGAAPPCS